MIALVLFCLWHATPTTTPAATASVEVLAAQVAATQTLVDLQGLPAEDYDVLMGQEEGCGKGEESPGGYVPWPKTATCQAARFPVGASVAVTDATGTRQASVVGLGSRAGYEHPVLFLVLSGLPPRGPSVAIRGREVPATFALRPVAAPGAKTTALAPALFKALTVRDQEQTAAGDEASLDLRKSLATYLKRAKRRVATGHFAGGATQLVTLTHVVSPADGGPATIFETMFFASPTASVGTVVHPSVDHGADRPEWLLDADGDGNDEVLVTSDCYEGAYQLLLRWDGAQARGTVLSGTSAGGCGGLLSAAAAPVDPDR